MFDTSQESPVKSPPGRTSESPTPCSGYDFQEESVSGQAICPQASEPHGTAYPGVVSFAWMNSCSPLPGL